MKRVEAAPALGEARYVEVHKIRRVEGLPAYRTL